METLIKNFAWISNGNAINKQMNEETRFLIRKHEYDCELFTKLET